MTSVDFARSQACLMQEADTVMPRKRKLSYGRGNREDPESRKERKQELKEVERLSSEQVRGGQVS